MKLISCHIENYGSLSNANYNFSVGFNQIYSSNGMGKSTLASFIKAMFYGLPADATNSKFNERRHFRPFSGGNFGGNLTFEYRGSTYRIERLFGKSKSGDELRIYENGSPCNKFASLLSAGRELGEIVFGLDELSFARTLFFNSDRSELTSTGSINAKLNDYFALNDGETSLEDAVAALDRAAKKLKMRGGKGRIAELEEEIKRCRLDIAEGERISAALDEKYAELNAVRAKISALEAQEADYNKLAELRQKWARFDDYNAAAEKAGQRIAEIEGAYPAGMPTERDAAELNGAVLRQAELNAKISSGQLSEGENARLAELESFFGGSAPGSALIDEMSEKAGRLTAERVYAEAAEAQGDSHYEKLCSQFSSGEPTDEQMDDCAQSVGRIKELNSAPEGQAGYRRANMTALVLALACAACGAVLFALSQTSFGIVMLCVSGALLIATAATWIYARKRASERTDGDVEQKVKDFLSSYGVDMSNGTEYAFARLKENLAEYRALRAENAQRESALSDRKKSIKALEEEVEKFLSPYNLTGDIQSRLSELRSRAGQYATLKSKRSASRAAVAALKGELDGLEAAADGILIRCNLSGMSYANASSKIRADISERERLIADRAQAKKSAEEFAKANSLKVRPSEDGAASSAQELGALRSREAVISSQINADEAHAEALSEKTNALRNAQEELEECKKRYSCYVAAGEFLHLAERSLNDKYVAPIRDRFAAYAEELKSVLGGEVSMDRNFTITYEEGGMYRTDDHLSSGQRAVVAFCFRLALIDNIFGDDLPFIVMDDPFCDLDEDHLSRAAKLVAKLSASRQIVYFCCHESRRMN